MTTFTAQVVARPISEDMFADLGYAHVDFEALPTGGVQVTVDATLTADQIVRARCRLASADADRESLLWSAYQAWQSDGDYLAITAPTNAQVVAQVAALTRQVRSVIKYLLPELT